MFPGKNAFIPNMSLLFGTNAFLGCFRTSNLRDVPFIIKTVERLREMQIQPNVRLQHICERNKFSNRPMNNKGVTFAEMMQNPVECK